MPRRNSPEPGAGLGGSRWPAVLALTGLAGLLVLSAGNPLEMAERKWCDQALRWRARGGWTPPADPRITILSIDDADIATLPDLGREYQAVAGAIAQAADLGAGVIVLDAIYVRGTAEMARPILAAVEQAGPVVFAEAVLPGGRLRLRSFPFLAEAMQPAGLINIQADGDGVLRSAALLDWQGQNFEPSLALAAYWTVRGIDWRRDVHQPGPRILCWKETAGGEIDDRAPVSRLLNFRGSWAQGAGFRHLNLRGLRALHAAHSANGGQPLAGKIVILANTATGVADVGTTPFGPNQPNVLLHATALNDLLQDSFLRRAPRWGDALALLTVVLLGAPMAWCARKRWLVVLWLLGLAAILGTGLALIFQAGLVVASVSTAGLWTLVIVGELARRHTREFAERLRLRSTMGLYFTPRVLEAVLENPGRLEPKNVEITVLLTDLRNSTPLVERLGAEGMLALLNRVFEVQNRAVFLEEGSLETPVGDQFLAYWGAPEPQPDAVERAMRAALALIEGLHELHASLEPEVRELFGYGVGLHAGRSLIGNIGSEQFFHYGLVGDLINAAARIESLTKHYGVVIIVTREVYEKLRQPPPARVLDHVIVKGKSTPLELIEVQHRFNAENFSVLTERYAAAFALYQRGDFAEAALRFEELAVTDKPSALLAERCRGFAADPPEEWHGIYKLENK